MRQHSTFLLPRGIGPAAPRCSESSLVTTPGGCSHAGSLRPVPSSFDRKHVSTAASGCRWTPSATTRRWSSASTCPGVEPDALDVEVERNVLTVRAERSWAPAEGDEVLAQERPQGSVDPPGDARRRPRHRPPRRHVRRRGAHHHHPGGRAGEGPQGRDPAGHRAEPLEVGSPQLTAPCSSRLAAPSPIGGADVRVAPVTSTLPALAVEEPVHPSPSTRSRSGSSSSPSCASRRCTRAAPAAVERQHQRGKLTARERIELLLDPGLVRRARHARPPPRPRVRDREHPAAHRRRRHRLGHGRRSQGVRVQPGLHRVRRRARRGVRREDPQGDGPRRVGRRADDRAQRRRRRPHPGRCRLARRVRRHLLPQREGVGRDPADQRDPRARAPAARCTRPRSPTSWSW